ncbi:response regulator transcription factor [Amycolatopsis sp. CA-230715]|uniref:response regulator transcription factor n=1 Tax=Amycolatopsis sp. CA-230715 TaxID=2745196 RepID=UPI001C32A62A|nr:response regulator transcription factor [Amycolatopsis sp. CA-230715]QWF76856.1 Response regulator GacA [Amycolatopsis sp. CA-230715]
MVRLLLVEDHDMVADALALAFDEVEDVEVVARARSVAETVVAAERHRPSVVLLDRRLSDGDAVASIGEILEASPDSRVLVYTGDANRALADRVVVAGGSGLVLKAGPFGDLVGAIRRVADGYGVFADSPALSPARAPAPASRPGEGDFRLTEGEREVLRMLAAGTEIDDIGTRLRLEPGLVRHVVRGIMAKLGVTSEAGVVPAARRHGLLERTERRDG